MSCQLGNSVPSLKIFHFLFIRPFTSGGTNASFSSTSDYQPSKMKSESFTDMKTQLQNRRRIMNVSSVRLNLELERMHTIELIELEEKLSQKAKKKSALKKSSAFDEESVGELGIEKDKLKEILKDTQNKNENSVQQIIRKSIKIQEPEPSFSRQRSVVDDSRYQSLIYSMTNVYRPDSAAKKNDNPDDRIVRLFRSNTAFIRENSQLITLQEQEKPTCRLSFEENYRKFQRAISNII